MSDLFKRIPERREEGGSHYDVGKSAIELVPPEVLLGVGDIMEVGKAKYGNTGNWTKGIKYSRVYASVMRHMLKWYSGEDLDPESGQSHLHHAIANIMFLSFYDFRGMNHLDDRGQYGITDEGGR